MLGWCHQLTWAAGKCACTPRHDLLTVVLGQVTLTLTGVQRAGIAIQGGTPLQRNIDVRDSMGGCLRHSASAAMVTPADKRPSQTSRRSTAPMVLPP